MRIILSIVIFYISICLIIFIFQRKLQYLPSGELHDISNYEVTDFTAEKLTTKDGVEIISWFKAPKNNSKILIYFHGNGGNLGGRSMKFKIFTENSDYGILAISYRGYPGSAGKPTEKGILLDAEAATDFLISKGYSNKDFILYGESLGSGVALQHALKIDPAGIVLEAPYYSIANIAKLTYWYLPVDLLLKDKYESYKYAKQLTIPVLIFHGTEDTIVPYEEGKALYNEFQGIKTFMTMSKADHLEFDELYLITAIKEFFYQNI